MPVAVSVVEATTAVTVVEDTVCDALTVYVPVPSEFTETTALIVVPAVTPVPLIV